MERGGFSAERRGRGWEESMGIFARKRENGAGAAVQLREGTAPFGVLDGYVPLSQGRWSSTGASGRQSPLWTPPCASWCGWRAGSRCPAGRALPRRGWTGSSSM